MSLKTATGLILTEHQSWLRRLLFVLTGQRQPASGSAGSLFGLLLPAVAVDDGVLEPGFESGQVGILLFMNCGELNLLRPFDLLDETPLALLGRHDHLVGRARLLLHHFHPDVRRQAVDHERSSKLVDHVLPGLQTHGADLLLAELAGGRHGRLGQLGLDRLEYAGDVGEQLVQVVARVSQWLEAVDCVDERHGDFCSNYLSSNDWLCVDLSFLIMI